MGNTCIIGEAEATEGFYPNMKAQKLSDGTWETATTGTEYYCPKQYGGIHGIVVRQYFTGTLSATTTVLMASFTYTLIESGGFIVYTVNDMIWPLPIFWGTDHIHKPRLVGTDIGVYKSQAGSTGKTYWAWVDYVK